MRRFLVLFHRLILRDLANNRSRALLTLSGVALGIAVVAGVQLANDRAIGSFNRGLRLLGGQADLQITANGLPLDERLIGELSWAWDVGAMTAIVEGVLESELPAAGTDENARESIRLFGVDLLSDAPFRTYTVRDDAGGRNLGLDITREEFIDLLVEPDAIIVPAALARRWNAPAGSAVRLLAANRFQDFTVRAVLTDEGAAAAFDGRVVFMDIAAAQRALDRRGEIDRIEIVLDRPEMAEAVAERIRVQLPEGVLVYAPEDAEAQAEKMTRAFRYNLAALSYIALAVGMILIYNTLNIAVIRRRGEIGALRTLGMGRRAIQAMFLLEALLFGIAGALLGIAGGEFLARAAGALVSRTLAAIYIGGAASGAAGGPDILFYAEMVLLGMILAAFSGLGPARRAMRITPVEALRQSAAAGALDPRRARLLNLGGAGALLAGALLSFAPPVGAAPGFHGFPFLGYAAGVLFIIGFSLLAAPISRVLLHAVRRPVVWMWPSEGRLAVETMSGRLGRMTVAVVSLAIAVAMLASVAIMVASFRDTVVVWMSRTLRGDLYIRPAIQGADGGRNTFDGTVIDGLADIPGIAAIDAFRARSIEYDGFPAVLGAGDFRVLAQHGDLLFVDGRSAADVANRVVGADRVVVSEPFAVRHGVAAGDTLSLPAPGGPVVFTVEAVFYDYSTENGMAVMDRGTYLARFGDTGVSNAAIYLAPGAHADTVRAEIARRSSGLELRVSTNRDLREQVLRVFDQTFEVTYALQVIALAVAMLGVTNTLAALIMERRPELAMLRFAGAGRGQIRRIVVLEAGLVGVLGAAIGLALGVVLSFLLIGVINFQSFGWTIQFSAPVGFLAQAIGMVLAVTLVAGLYPASLALRIDPIKAIRAE